VSPSLCTRALIRLCCVLFCIIALTLYIHIIVAYIIQIKPYSAYMLVYERDTIEPAPSAVNKQSVQGTTQQEDMDIDSNSNDSGPVQQLEDEVKLLLFI
jgi:hypothetical protein